MIFVNNIPRWLVNEIINTYEKKDIYLDINETYLYHKKNLLEKKFIKPADIQKFVINTRGIKYTCFEYGIKTKNYLKNHLILDDIIFREYAYISFYNFNLEISNNVCNLLDKYKNYKYLILDIRNNPGGELESCLEICNKLLPKCTIVHLKYKNKEIQHYSNENYVKFKKIFIFLNENSASCSEILSLSLKKNLENVFLIGNESAKKYIGQTTFVNKKYKFIFSISDFTWSVLGENTKNLQYYLSNDNKNSIIYKTKNDFMKQILNYEQS